MSEQDRLLEILGILSREDPTFTTRQNEETGQLIISGMGELHIDVLVTRILKEYGLDAKVGNPQVTYRESVEGTSSHTGVFSRIIAGKENAASVRLTVAPGERGGGNRYVCDVKDGHVPRNVFDAIERGVEGALASGIVMGYPCMDVSVTVTGVEYSELTGTEFAFEACASGAFDEAAKKAFPILLEPIMAVSLVCPREAVGDVMSLVTQRGGNVLHMDSRSQFDEIRSEAPMEKMFGFMTALRSVSQGRATFTMEFSHFEKRAAAKRRADEEHI
jgi:elongation factor G